MPRVPTVAQWDRWHLCSVGTKVRSPGPPQLVPSGLKIWHCRSCSIGVDLISGPGTPCATGHLPPPKKNSRCPPVSGPRGCWTRKGRQDMERTLLTEPRGPWDVFGLELYSGTLGQALHPGLCELCSHYREGSPGL